MVTQLNPEWLAPADYVAFLNRSFPGQWDRAAYDWYVARAFNGRNCDLLVQAEDGRLLAGVTLGYRQIAMEDGPLVELAILSAAGTLPEERGRGRWAALVESALELARRRECAALAAFVTAVNASGRGLRRLGAHAIPSFYIASPAKARPRRRGARRAGGSKPSPERVLTHAAYTAPAGDALARFHYRDPEDWLRQFVRRPYPVAALRLAHDCLALVESAPDTDRLQYLAGPVSKHTDCVAVLASTAAAAGRGFFTYTLDPNLAAAARRLGLRIRDGYLMLLPTGHAAARWERLARATWHVQSGDRL